MRIEQSRWATVHVACPDCGAAYLEGQAHRAACQWSGVSGAGASVALGPPVADLSLSSRAQNILGHHGIRRLGEVAMRSRAEWLQTKNFGRQSLDELAGVMAAHGLKYKGDS